jgi:hypothetical protein
VKLSKFEVLKIFPKIRKTLTPYPTETENQMQEMYSPFIRKGQANDTGVDALKLPYGSYIAKLFGCSRNTVKRGIIALGVSTGE